MKDIRQILANETRLQILEMLNYGKKMSFTELMKYSNIPSNQFAYHLKLLLESGMIESEGDGYKLSWLGSSLSPYFDILSVSLQPLIVIVIKVMNENKILLIKRSKDAFRGYWAMPGGKMYFGETPADAVKRIIKKKAGIEVTSVELIASFLEKVKENGDTKYHFLKLLFDAEAKTNDLVSGKDGIVKWVKINEVHKMKMIPSDLELIRSMNGKIFRFGNITMDLNKEKLRLNKMEMKNFFA